MTQLHITILFEFDTLNGGERSILAAIDWFRIHDSRFHFTAIGPPAGRLGSALRERAIPLVPWSARNADGQRRLATDIDNSLIQMIDSLRPDIVHANSLAMGRLLGRVATRILSPATAHLRDIIKLSAAAIADLNRNRKLVAVSQATRLFHVAQGGDADKITVIYNGIDLDRFHPHPKTGWLRVELRQRVANRVDFSRFDSHGKNACASGVDHPAVLIACIGQIGLRKGQDVLASAARAIVEQVPHAHFLLVGERTSQKEESIEFERAVLRRFDDEGLSDRLTVLGTRDDVPELLSEIDLLIHPANQEPLGRVLLEACAAGVPIVATNVGGTPEIIEDGITGRLVPAGNPKALSEAAIAILNNPTESDRLRCAARQRAEQKFSIESAARYLASFWLDTHSTADGELPHGGVGWPDDNSGKQGDCGA